MEGLPAPNIQPQAPSWDMLTEANMGKPEASVSQPILAAIVNDIKAKMITTRIQNSFDLRVRSIYFSK